MSKVFSLFINFTKTYILALVDRPCECFNGLTVALQYINCQMFYTIYKDISEGSHQQIFHHSAGPNSSTPSYAKSDIEDSLLILQKNNVMLLQNMKFNYSVYSLSCINCTSMSWFCNT